MNEKNSNQRIPQALASMVDRAHRRKAFGHVLAEKDGVKQAGSHRDATWCGDRAGQPLPPTPRRYRSLSDVGMGRLFRLSDKLRSMNV